MSIRVINAVVSVPRKGEVSTGSGSDRGLAISGRGVLGPGRYRSRY